MNYRDRTHKRLYDVTLQDVKSLGYYRDGLKLYEVTGLKAYEIVLMPMPDNSRHYKVDCIIDITDRVPF